MAVAYSEAGCKGWAIPAPAPVSQARAFNTLGGPTSPLGEGPGAAGSSQQQNQSTAAAAASPVAILRQVKEQQPVDVQKELETVKQAVMSARASCLTRHSSSSSSCKSSDLDALAAALARRGLYTTVRSGLGASGKQNCFQQVRHRFIICQLAPRGTQIFVDPLFREQFFVGYGDRSQGYNECATSLPKCFVGTLPMLHAVSLTMTSHLTNVLGATAALPPWRTAQGLLSRWLPRSFTDTALWPSHSSMQDMQPQQAPIKVITTVTPSSASTSSATSSTTSTPKAASRPVSGANHPPQMVVVGFAVPGDRSSSGMTVLTREISSNSHNSGDTACGPCSALTEHLRGSSSSGSSSSSSCSDASGSPHSFSSLDMCSQRPSLLQEHAVPSTNGVMMMDDIKAAGVRLLGRLMYKPLEGAALPAIRTVRLCGPTSNTTANANTAC